jgi:hypothetical protein
MKEVCDLIWDACDKMLTYILCFVWPYVKSCNITLAGLKGISTLCVCFFSQSKMFSTSVCKTWKQLFDPNYTPTRREGAILQSPCPSVHTFVKDVSAATGRNDFIFDTWLWHSDLYRGKHGKGRHDTIHHAKAIYQI